MLMQLLSCHQPSNHYNITDNHFAWAKIKWQVLPTSPSLQLFLYAAFTKKLKSNKIMVVIQWGEGEGFSNDHSLCQYSVQSFMCPLRTCQGGGCKDASWYLSSLCVVSHHWERHISQDSHFYQSERSGRSLMDEPKLILMKRALGKVAPWEQCVYLDKHTVKPRLSVKLLVSLLTPQG